MKRDSWFWLTDCTNTSGKFEPPLIGHKSGILRLLTSWSCKGQIKFNMAKAVFKLVISPTQLFCNVNFCRFFLHFNWDVLVWGGFCRRPDASLWHPAMCQQFRVPVSYTKLPWPSRPPSLSLVMIPMTFLVCFIIWTVCFNICPVISPQYMILSLHWRDVPCWGKLWGPQLLT